MKLTYLSLFLVSTLPGTLCARPKTDTLVMTNGDRFTCEIKKLERGVLYASLDYVDGTVSIAWSKVARVESSQLFIVHTEAGAVYEGALRTVATSADQPVTIEVLEPTENAAKLKRTNVVEMAQTAESFWRRLSGNVDSGLMYTKGNSTTQYNLSTEVRLRRDLWSAQANFASTLSRSKDVDASTRNQANLRAYRLIGRRQWFYDGAGQFLQSSQQGINIQSTLSGGIGKFVKDSNNARIAWNAGLAYQSTQYAPSVGSQSPPNSLGALIAGDMHLFRFKKTALDATVSVLPVLTEIGRFRTYVNTAYSVQIISNLWIKFSFSGNWDNRPPAAFSGSDYGASTGISWSFN
jgi:nuclear transport factor 2 (NTF2) superfamily protein